MSKEIVVKSNSLIQASYTLGLVEQRMILMAIVAVRESGHGICADTLCHVRADDYARVFGVARQTAYQVLADAVETLFNRRVTLSFFDPQLNKSIPLTVRWVTAMNYLENEALVTLRFGSEVIPHITRLEANFTSYELNQVADLKSAYAVRLYEILIKWRSVGKTPVFLLSDFRNNLGLVESEYQRMGAFKERVLDLAISQINAHTDITVSYEQHKRGRVITGFSFSFKTKNIKPVDKQPKQLQEKRTARQTKPMPEVADPWDKLHQAELKACQKINPALCRADVQRMAQEQGVGALEVMRIIQKGVHGHEFN